MKNFCLLCFCSRIKKIYFKCGSLKIKSNDYLNPSLLKPIFPKFIARVI